MGRAEDPIIVGGLGGSGTRVLARLLLESGVFLGADLNPALDNLWFTLLFKHPGLRNDSERAGTAICRRIKIMDKAMTGNSAWKIDELVTIGREIVRTGLHGHDHKGSGKGFWSVDRGLRLLQQSPAAESARTWGYKEPNTHLFLPELANYYTSLRFVFVVRHGLDMAFSRNTAQLHNWGSYFRVNPHSDEPLPPLQLRYWIAANRRAQQLGDEMLGKRFIWLNYDRLCARPHSVISTLWQSLDLECTNLDHLASIPTRPPSSGRYLKQDLSIFDDDLIDAVRSFGFNI